jgi:hypothetical protein
MFDTEIIEVPHRRPRPGEKRSASYETGSLSRRPAIHGEPLPWCFRCKTFSHLLRDCHNALSSNWSSTDIVTSDPSLDEFLFSIQQELDRDVRFELCESCSRIDIGKLFRSPISDQNFSVRLELGEAGSAEFISSCPVCRLLISTALRLDPGTHTRFEIWGVLAPCMTTVDVDALCRKLGLLPHFETEVLDALGYMKDSRAIPRSLLLCTAAPFGDRARFLPIKMGIGLRTVRGADATSSPKLVGPRPDYDMIKSWLDTCETSHSNCATNPAKPVGIDIRVVDVHRRMVVTWDATQQLPYIALSYVWGNVEQKGAVLNTRLDRLPQTIEDAMEVVRKLGKDYLWVDALCIDQSDEEHKREQITIMDRIYRGAWATIINLSGTSANSALPRVSGDFYIRQRHFISGEDHYVSTLPALATYAKQSLWNSRAWVMQEALLSQRCLFFTHCQVYFECNTCQDSEFISLQNQAEPSLDISHLATGLFRLGLSDLQATEPRSLRNTRVRLYRSLLENYRRRHMTYISDSLNAFSGIVDALWDGFSTKFLYGLPVADFPYALGWRQLNPVQRTPSFPSWSWTAWEGELAVGAIIPHEYVSPGASASQIVYI